MSWLGVVLGIIIAALVYLCLSRKLKSARREIKQLRAELYRQKQAHRLEVIRLNAKRQLRAKMRRGRRDLKDTTCAYMHGLREMPIDAVPTVPSHYHRLDALTNGVLLLEAGELDRQEADEL